MSVSQASIIESLELVCSNLNSDDFIYEFMDAYGFPKSTVTRLRNVDDSRNVGEGEDIALKKRLYFKRVDTGGDVNAVADDLKASDVVARNEIRFVIVTDFKILTAYDLRAEERLEIAFEELPKQYGFFLPLAGYEKAVMHSEHPADLKASEKMGQLFDLIKERNDLSQPEDIHALNVFLTRLLFCFYAEDTGIFEESQMSNAIFSYTQTDGSDVDQFFTDFFTVLNLKDGDAARTAMPAHFQAFPYVNGKLFEIDEPVPEFGARARRILIDCGSLNWSEINPDIFGSMFQAVIDEEQRGNLGQHYTSVSNIMKVIAPLFLDELYEELEASKGNEKRLKALLLRLQNIRIFDPACGSGNFLIIAYKELRKLEMEIIDALNVNDAQSVMYYSGIRLNQFYGIEIDDFAQQTAILSLWLAEHQMNTAFKAKFGYAEAALPLSDSGHIVCGNSLRLDWEEVCPKEDEQGKSLEVYVCGNPPFLGATYRTSSQNEDMDYVFKGFKKHRFLDYVACFFWKGAQYIRKSGSLSLVSTSSICQGEQVAMLWPSILKLGVKISFAYPSFTWSNNAKSRAAVHVAIIGLSSTPKVKVIYRIIDNQLQRVVVNNISPYLIEGSNLTISSRSKPLGEIRPIVRGNQPTDGGNLLLTREEKNYLLEHEPKSKKWIKRVLGAAEFINAKERYCLWLVNASDLDIDKMPLIKERVNRVREVRLASRDKGAQKLAERSHQFRDLNNPEKFIVIPRVSSERRFYIPIGFFDASVISTDANQIIPNATLYEFGVLTSEIHNDWMRAVGGRLKSDYRYSGQLVYNTFPWPEASAPKRKEIEELAEEVLLIREDYPERTLAELYDPDKMPKPLLEAHKALDRAVDTLYRRTPFKDASERLEHLFARYEKLIAEEEAQKRSKGGK